MSDTATRRYLDYPTAADYVGLSVATLRRAVERGEIRPLRPSPGRVVFDVRALDEWVQASAEPAANH